MSLHRYNRRVDLKKLVAKAATCGHFCVNSRIEMLARFICGRIGQALAQDAQAGKSCTKFVGNASTLCHQNMKVHYSRFFRVETSTED